MPGSSYTALMSGVTTNVLLPYPRNIGNQYVMVRRRELKAGGGNLLPKAGAGLHIVLLPLCFLPSSAPVQVST